MLILESILIFFLWLVGLYLLFNCLYLLTFALAGLVTRNEPDEEATGFVRFCILIPAYKEDVVILDTVREALAQQYRGQSDVFVIADGLKPQTLRSIETLGGKAIEVHFEKSTKGKALQFAVSALPEDVYDAVLVLDADNVMDSNFLEKVNLSFQKGYQVVQGHRTAKNQDTPFALLDACNEEINNQLFRKGHQALGVSPNLIGSGMAFGFSYLKKLLANIGEVSGEDKEIDFRIARDKVKTDYLHHALVYDEKVANARVFTGQRSRWISAQIACCKKYFFEGFVQLFRHGNTDFFNKMVQTLLLPRILLLGALGIMFMQSLVNPYGPPALCWAILLLTGCGSLLIALPGRFYRASLWKAVLHLPLAFLSMCRALLRSRKTGQTFVHTPHVSKTITSDIRR